MENKNKLMSEIILYVLMAMLFLAFLCVAILVMSKHNFKIDNFLPFVSRHRPSALTKLFKVLTHLGSAVVLGVISLIFLLIYKNKKDGFFALFNFAIVAVICTIIKYIVRRARPVGFMLIDEVGFSFPSAHAALSAALFGAFAALLAMRVKNKPLKFTLMAIFIILPIFVGFTRIYLGVHFPSDILAGLTLGWAITILSSIIYIKFVLKKRDKKTN